LIFLRYQYNAFYKKVKLKRRTAMHQKSGRRKRAVIFLYQITLFYFSAVFPGGLPDLPDIDDQPSSAPSQNLTTQIIRGDFAGKPELMFSSWQSAGDSQKKTFWNPGSQPMIQTQQNKTLIPPAAASVFQQMSGSFLRARAHINHPAGSTLFAGAAFAGQLDSFITACKTADEGATDNLHTFLVYFSQFHLYVLQELAHYLVGVYTTLSLTTYGQYSQKYLDYVRNNSGKEPSEQDNIDTWQIYPLPDYLAHEDEYSLNKKTLIINHLINIIQTQINKSFLARFPALPQTIASRAGMTMMSYDYGAKLELLLKEQELAFVETIAPTISAEEKNNARTIIGDMRTRYMNALSSYFTFFQSYTKLLEQKNGAQEFARFAKGAEMALANMTAPAGQATTKGTITQLRQADTVNPPLFFYNDDVIRGIKLIPAVAQTLPANAKSVPLPQKIVAAADMGTKLPFSNNYVAFRDNGVLYVTLSSAQGTFAQKVIPQPAWLNNPQGVIKMLRACLGDFSTLLDDDFKQETILNPCLMCIIGNATQKPVSCTECTQYLTTLRDLVKGAL
jgi:hypothetical protein